MELMDAIITRQAIRKYKSDPIKDELLMRILEAGRLAPSGVNSQPWKFKLVKDAADRERLFTATKNQLQVKQAPVVIVICADTMSYSRTLKLRFKELLENGVITQADLNTMGLDVLTEDEEKDLMKYAESARFNTAIATEHMALMAAEVGLGSCWIHLFDKDAVSRMFNLPSWIIPTTLLTIGYADETPERRPRKSLEEIML